MCAHYEAPTTSKLIEVFGSQPEAPFQEDLFPTSMGPFIRLSSPEAKCDAAVAYEVLAGQFGLVPHWAKDRSFGRQTYNARSETVASKPSYRAAWKAGRHCVIPAAAIYEPDWRSGRGVPTRITRVDGGLLLIAGIWDTWTSPQGELIHSFSMLTVNAETHQLMKHFHKPDKEKRMVVILPSGAVQAWLAAGTDESQGFLRQYPADRLQSEVRPTHGA